MLVESVLITETRQETLRREQTGHHLANDTTTHVKMIEPDAPTREKQHRFYKTVKAFLAADDDTLRNRSRAAEWLDFELSPLRLWSPSLLQSRTRACVAVESRARRGRVISPPRRLAATPSRRRSRHTRTLLMTSFVRRNVAFYFIYFFLYDVLVLLYPYYLLRFHSAWPREFSHFYRIICIFVAWPRPLLSRFLLVYPLSNSRRIYVALRLLVCASLSFRA